MVRLIKFLFLFIYFLLPAICFADKIQGHACYAYGDNESLVQAEHTAKMLAIRNALESNTIFFESTSKITDFQLTSDLIKAVSAGQVKGVKVLKRLQSGRTICYTVEGNVDPNEMQNAINNFLKGKTEDVRLQENGWIRIISHFVEKKTWEEREKEMGGDPQKIPEFLKNKLLIRQLHVKIQFLKPCIATTRLDSIDKKPLSKTEEEIALGLTLTIPLFKDGHNEEANKIINALLEKYPNEYGQIVYDLTVPRFRCDYRIKVFVTFFSSEGYEINTDGEIPFAKFKSEYEFGRKKEMLPGETTYVTFVIPDEAKSWQVWVPK